MPNKLVVGVNDFKSWCIHNNRIDLLNEWDNIKNGKNNPNNTMYGSSYKAWWICKKGHSFQTVMYQRAKIDGSSCPICSNRKILVGYNDLATTHPQLSREWHPTKNGKLTPNEVTCGSLKKVWWFLQYNDPFTRKHFDFEWEAIISNRALKGSGCPFLAGRLWTGFNDLETVNPTLAKEWNFEKNKCLPSQIGANDNRLFWWKCSSCEFEWKAKVSNRNILNHGCPICGKIKQAISSRRTAVKLKKSLADTNPRLSKEWHPTKNGDLTPYNITSGSSDKVWWLLPYDDPNTGKHFDFEWKATIASRSAGCGCPFLQGRLWKGFNDLTVTNPEIVKFWHSGRNKKSPDCFTKGSHAKVWWLGNCGHEFESEISKQCTHFSCPICAKEQSSSFPEQAIYFYIKKFFPEAINRDRNELDGLELDVYIPSEKVAIEYDGEAWHTSADRDIIKSNRCSEKGIALYRVRENGCDDLKTKSDYVYTYTYGDWEELNNIISNICKKLTHKHISVDILRDEQAIFSQYLGIKQRGSIGELHPELIKFWHPTKNGTITPFNILSSSDKTVWRIDCFGHEYKCRVKEMTKGGEHCPYCNNRILLKGFNDLATKFPKIALEWAHELNDVSPSEVIYTKGKYWFRCNTCGSVWQALLSNRTRLGVGCPVCGHAKMVHSRASNNVDHYGKALSVAYPLLSEEWDSEKNGIAASEIFGFSTLSDKFWWKCRVCGNEWQSVIKNRTKGRGCPSCKIASKTKKVRNIDTGEIFDSVNEAAEKYQCTASSITNCCKGRIKTCKGYRWEYQDNNLKGGD